MASRRDQERIRALLTEAITVLCKNGLGYNSEFCIDGLLGITVDSEDIFLVKINEKISREKDDVHISIEPQPEQNFERRSVTSVSPERSLSLSQPPTPQSVSINQRTDSQQSESQSLDSPSRKRQADSNSQDAEPTKKRVATYAETNSIVVKEEVDSDSFHHYNTLPDQNANGDLGFPLKPGCSTWAQSMTPSHLNSSVNAQDDYLTDPLQGSITSSTSSCELLDMTKLNRTFQRNGLGRVIAKGMPIPNEERQLIIKTILDAGGNADTGKTPHGVLRAVGNAFHIQSSTVHNIWSRYWKYRIDTHGYCPGISDHKREINKKCKLKKQQNKKDRPADKNIEDTISDVASGKIELAPESCITIEPTTEKNIETTINQMTSDKIELLPSTEIKIEPRSPTGMKVQLGFLSSSEESSVK